MPALKGATLEMIKKDEEKKKKEEKDKLKKQQKEERKQQWQKEQAQKEKEQTEKAKQPEKNPYSVFAEKDDEEVGMEEESVVFTDSSSSDHLPKGTLPRLPVTKHFNGVDFRSPVLEIHRRYTCTNRICTIDPLSHCLPGLFYKRKKV